MFRNQMKVTFFISLCSLLFSQYSVAGLISLDDATFGADSIILDEDSGTEWLKIDLTVALAPEIRHGTGFGQRFKLANAGELRELMLNSGIITSSSCFFLSGCGPNKVTDSSNSGKAEAVREFQQLFGTTTTPDGFAEITGFYDIGTGFDTNQYPGGAGTDSLELDDWSTYGHWFLAVQHNSNNSQRGFALGCLTFHDCLSHTTGPGYWVIRTSEASIPEPSLFILLSLGLVTVFSSRRKKALKSGAI